MSNFSAGSVIVDESDPIVTAAPVQWALGQLRDALGNAPPVRTLIVSGAQAPRARDLIDRAGLRPPDGPEALAVVPGILDGTPVLLATGGDVRGLTYAILEVADRLRHATTPDEALALEQPHIGQPANRVRSVMRLFASDVEDKPWFWDRAFWEQYLSFMAAQRWNRVHLALGLSYDFPRNVTDSYLYFSYPFLLKVPGFDVRVTNFSDEERERNLDTLRFISDAAAARGLGFQLGLWTHAYELFESPKVNHEIQGLTPDRHARYCREAVATLLTACPNISGITFRIHGESGVAEGSFDFWAEVFGGVRDASGARRRIGIDLHSKGIEQPIIDLALATDLPVTISPKLWAEHMGPPYHQAEIRPLERSKVPGSWESHYMAVSAGSRRFTRYGYADLLREDRGYGIVYRIWPGTQRLLLWGDPTMAAGFGRSASFCGADGLELFEPLSFIGRRGSGIEGPRGGYADTALRPSEGDWAKYRSTYRLFGRHLYNPDPSPSEWKLARAVELGISGVAADAAESALAHASRILPLITVAHLPSAANNSYWPEMYTNQPIVDEGKPHPYSDTPPPKLFGSVSPLDPELFSTIEEFADEISSRTHGAKYTPLDVARTLDGLADTATAALAEAQAESLVNGAAESTAFVRLTTDVRLICSLGRFFAGKLRAGVAYALYRRSGEAGILREGVEAYRAARLEWQAAIETGSAYVGDLSFGPEPKLRGHWADRLAAIDADLADLEAELGRATPDISTLTFEALTVPAAPPQIDHIPPLVFTPGVAVQVAFALVADETLDVTSVAGATLRYRRVNQAERWQSVDMEHVEGEWRGAIPADYSASPYPLQYYFAGRPAEGRPWLHPGLDATLSNQPYYVVRHVKQVGQVTTTAA
jgi:hypothetical protein